MNRINKEGKTPSEITRFRKVHQGFEESCCFLQNNSYLCIDMEFFQTLGKGIIQGFNQFITYDLESYIPLFIIAAVLIIAVLLRNWIHKHK